jgi:hypothetical protein
VATTYIKPYKTARGMTATGTMFDRFEYGLNPQKCAAACSYLCDPKTAHAEFMLVKNRYEAITDRPADKGHLFFQIRQAFPPGEISIEEAQRIGYETAMRWTKGRYQFFVCTHADKGHTHNHIYYNSTSEDCSRKFHNFLGSSFAVRRLSDRVCLEHGLSIVRNPKSHSKGKYRHYGEWLGDGKPPSFRARLKTAIDEALTQKPKDFDAFLALLTEAGYEHKQGRGGALSFRTDGQEGYTRLRSSTLGAGYGLEDILDIIEGRVLLGDGRSRPAPKVNLIVDIQRKMSEGKGTAYERWAKLYNLKQMAAALQYLQEHNLLAYEDLAASAAAATDHCHSAAGKLKETEAAMKHNGELKAAIADYARTRPVFDEYKRQKYSNKYLAEHEADIRIHRAAQTAMRELLNGEKLPKMDALKAEWRTLAAAKKSGYADYRAAQSDMREVVAVKANIDYLLGIADGRKNKEMER